MNFPPTLNKMPILEVVRYNPGQLFFKGARDVTETTSGLLKDPMNTTSFQGIPPNMYKWITDDPHVAEIYGSGAGRSVWVYELKKPTYVLNIYDENKAVTTMRSMGILEKVITAGSTSYSANELIGNLIGNLDKQDALKIPFGLHDPFTQARLTGTLLPGLFNFNSRVFTTSPKIFQRMSHHNFDKYLTLFMFEKRGDILEQIKKLYPIELQNQNQNSLYKEFTDLGINGYCASRWNSDWHGNNFHSEICLFTTEYQDAQTKNTPIIFKGLYKVENNERLWYSLYKKRGEKCTAFNQVPSNIYPQQTGGAHQKNGKYPKQRGGNGNGSSSTPSLFGTASTNQSVDAFAKPNIVEDNNFKTCLTEDQLKVFRSNIQSRNISKDCAYVVTPDLVDVSSATCESASSGGSGRRPTKQVSKVDKAKPSTSTKPKKMITLTKPTKQSKKVT
jgi:hypothetical protein